MTFCASSIFGSSSIIGVRFTTTKIINAAPPRKTKFVTGIRRANGSIPRVIHNGRSDDPRLAPSISDIPTISGKASMDTIVIIIKIAANEECMKNVRTAPIIKAVKKSRVSTSEICGKNELSRTGITVVRINSKASNSRAMPSKARPICLGVRDLLFRNSVPPSANNNGISQFRSKLKNLIIRAEPRSAPIAAGRAS